jgi:TM2 domain-containing membrane protein YozV
VERQQDHACEIDESLNDPTNQQLLMDNNKVDMFILSNGKFFESNQLMHIRERLLTLDDSKWSVVQTLQFKDPTTSIIVSILAGGLGVDRFLIGDTGLGIGKLLTCGGLGIWALVDWFLIMGATREKNFIKLQQFLY